MNRTNRRRRCLLAITGAYDLGGGIAAANRLVLQALHDDGFALDVYALNEKPAAQAHYAELSAAKYRAFAGNKLAFTFAVWRSLLSRRYSFVFCDHVNLAAMLAPFAILKLVRYAVRLNGVEVFPPLPTVEGRLGLRFAWKRIAISDFTRQKVVRQFSPLPISVCDLALDPRYTDLPLPERVPEIMLTNVNDAECLLGKRVILHVGRMSSTEQYKGQDVLIYGMTPILARYPDAQLVLVGHGDDAARLKNLAMAQKPSVQNAIFMPGFVQDSLLDQLYQLAYVFAMPSQGEGFGLVYLEAMRWARPCIGSRIDAAQCIIQHGETGLLSSTPGDPDEVAQLILYLFDHPDTARAMGQAGYNRLKANYLFPHFKERFLRILELSS